MKLVVCLRIVGVGGRAPHGARGLKHNMTIKISITERRAPHGARGLKR